MSSKPKILVIIPNLDYGGAQISFSKLCNDLDDFFCVIPCVYTLPDTEIPYAFKVSPIVLSKDYNGLIGKFFKFLSLIVRLRKLKKVHQVVASISFMESANYLNVLSSRGENTIISHRGSYLHDQFLRSRHAKIRLNYLMPLLFSRASNNVCVSTALAEEVTVNYRVNPNKVSIIQNYYDLDSLVKKSEEHIPEKYQFLKDKNYLVAVGRLHSQKGYSALIELYSVIKEDINTSLVIVGSGDLLEDLIKECIDLNLRPCVIEDTPPDADFDVYFLGYVKNSLPIVSHAKMFLLTSFWEGFPNVLIEAMAAKTLVLASDCPTGPSEILISHDLSGNSVESNTYGILLPTLENKADFVLWRDAILKYHSDSTEKQEIIKKAFSSLDRFSRINSIDKWRDIINGK